MKVIKSGDGRKCWAEEFVCSGGGNGNGGCGATLLVEASDLYETRSYARDEYEAYTTFSCPECKCETDVVIPSSVEITGCKPSERD